MLSAPNRKIRNGEDMYIDSFQMRGYKKLRYVHRTFLDPQTWLVAYVQF